MSPKEVMKKAKEPEGGGEIQQEDGQEGENIDIKQNVWQNAQAEFSICIKVRHHKFSWR